MIVRARISFALFLGLAALGNGCASRERPVRTPPPVEPQTRLAPKREATPPVIAPPPAYGNKIVMARRPAASPL